MPQMKKLPEYIQFSTPELALACVAFLVEVHGWHRDTNCKAERGFSKNLEFRGGGCKLRFYEDIKTIATYSSGLAQFDPRLPLISSLAEFMDLVQHPPIRVGEYEVEFRTDGLKVGCTFVPWKTLNAIYTRRMQVQGEQEGNGAQKSI